MLKTHVVVSFFCLLFVSGLSSANAIVRWEGGHQDTWNKTADADCEALATPTTSVVLENITLGTLTTEEDIERQGQKVSAMTSRLGNANTKAFMDLTPPTDVQALGYKQMTDRTIVGNGKTLSEVFEDYNTIAIRLRPPSNFIEPTTSVVKSSLRALAKRAGVYMPPTVQEYLASYSMEYPNFEKVLAAFQAQIETVQQNKIRATGELNNMLEVIRAKTAEKLALIAQRDQLQAEIDAQNLSTELKLKAEFSIILPYNKLIGALSEHIKAHSLIASQKKAVIDQTDDVVDTVTNIVSITTPAIRNSATTISDAIQNEKLLQAAQVTRDVAMDSIDATSRVIDRTFRQTNDLRSKPVLDNSRLVTSITVLRDAMLASQQFELKLPGQLAEAQKRTDTLQLQIDLMGKGQLLQIETTTEPVTTIEQPR